ncbi:MAG: hypothetical protein KGI37_09170 [Alphaproteobacteria bacterium]|nr:hypothetical protein [Alphaproteobacteria bacterium]
MIFTKKEIVIPENALFHALAQENVRLSGIQFAFSRVAIHTGFRVRAKARPGMTALFSASTALT